VTALKKAESGKGVVVRLFRCAPGPVSVRMTYQGRPVKKALLTDGLEREIQPLALKNNTVELNMPFFLATVLLEF
jgi:alpha-mannosidase